MNRYLCILTDDDELLCSIDTHTGEAICKNGINIKSDEYEDVIRFEDGAMKHVCFDH